MNDTTRKTGWATYKNMRISAQKVRLVLDQIRSLKTQEASHILSFSNKKCAPLVLGVLNSAVANMAHHYNADTSKLYIEEVYANEGVTLKRIKAGSRGNAKRILRRSAHVTIKLCEGVR